MDLPPRSSPQQHRLQSSPPPCPTIFTPFKLTPQLLSTGICVDAGVQIFADNTKSIKAIIPVQFGQEEPPAAHLHLRAERPDTDAAGEGPAAQVWLLGKAGKLSPQLYIDAFSP